MKRFYFNLLAIIALILLAGCGAIAPLNPRYIHSNSVHSPNFFKEKGDIKLSLDGSMENKTYISTITENGVESKKFNYKISTTALDPKIAYAFHKNLYVSLGGSFRKEKEIYPDNDIAVTETPSTIKYKRRAIDVALGAFFPLTEQKRSYLTFEAGVNLGDLYSSLSAPNISPEIYYFNANTYKYYITPGFDYHFSPYLRVNFNTKLLLLNYGNIRTNYSDYNLSHTQLDYLYSNNIRTSESSLYFQFGSKRIDWIKINLGLHSAGFIEQKAYYNYNLKIRNIYWSAGFTLYPNFLFK